MSAQKPDWKKGRGNLGPLQPLLGKWKAATDSPMGKVTCTREFSPILSGKYVKLKATWEFSSGTYEELAIYGMKDGVLSFWSFTSDGKKSEGILGDGSDVHPQSICFEANMPAGIARMIYWPGETKGNMHWAVESKNKKGWHRFTEHNYTLVDH
jgi:hypothetical protein